MPNSDEERILSIAADVFNVPQNGLTKDSSPRTVAHWDSMQHLNLILSLEQSFGMRFTPEEIMEMDSIGKIVSMVEKKRRVE